MGEIADAIIEGEICQVCCMPLDEPMGFPQTCSECYEPLRKRRPGGFTILSEKVNDKLRTIREMTLRPAGIYPGNHLDSASAQHQKLIKHGYAKIFTPDNPSHSTRVVITGRGYDYLKFLEARKS